MKGIVEFMSWSFIDKNELISQSVVSNKSNCFTNLGTTALQSPPSTNSRSQFKMPIHLLTRNSKIMQADPILEMRQSSLMPLLNLDEFRDYLDMTSKSTQSEMQINNSISNYRHVEGIRQHSRPLRLADSVYLRNNPRCSVLSERSNLHQENQYFTKKSQLSTVTEPSDLLKKSDQYNYMNLELTSETKMSRKADIIEGNAYPEFNDIDTLEF